MQALIDRIFDRSPDAFYEKSYAGWYCVGCEAFKTDAEIVDRHCVLHPTRELEWVEERNWFFRLSAYADAAPGADRERAGRSCSRRAGETKSSACSISGLEDVSASRSRNTWAVPFPRATSDGQPQSTYVWFDALPNYLTGTGFPGRRRMGDAVAGTGARHRQGHHALSLRDLAGDADGGAVAAARARVGSRLRAARR